MLFIKKFILIKKFNYYFIMLKHNFTKLIVFSFFFITMQDVFRDFFYNIIIINPGNNKIIYYIFKNISSLFRTTISVVLYVVTWLEFCPPFLAVLRFIYLTLLKNLIFDSIFEFDFIFFYTYWIIFFILNYYNIYITLFKIYYWLYDFILWLIDDFLNHR